MVTFMYPSGHPNAEALGMQISATNTLFGLLPVAEHERASAVKRVLNSGVGIVIPDTYTPTPAWVDVLTALRACKHPIYTLSSYMNALIGNKPAAGAAAPPTQQQPVAGLSIVTPELA